MNEVLEFTCFEGIINVIMSKGDFGMVDIILKRDDGTNTSIAFPLWKFEWLVEQYNNLKD